jgi:hypothetical protein
MAPNLHKRKIELLQNNCSPATLAMIFVRILPGLASLRGDSHMQSRKGAAMRADHHLSSRALNGLFTTSSGSVAMAAVQDISRRMRLH